MCNYGLKERLLQDQMGDGRIFLEHFQYDDDKTYFVIICMRSVGAVSIRSTAIIGWHQSLI